MNEITILCVRCSRDAVNGLAYTFQGPATGHNKDRGVLCPDCVAELRWFLRPVEHVNSSDPVTPAGLAHIATCRECNDRYSGGMSGVPVLQDRQRTAQRFASGGYAQ